MNTLLALGELLAELGIGASLVDRELRLVWCNRTLRERMPELAVERAEHCFAAHWCRKTRCADCLPVLVFRTGEAHEGYRERNRPGEARRLYRVRAIPVNPFQEEAPAGLLVPSAGRPSHVLEAFVDVSDLGRLAGLPELGSGLSTALTAAGHGLYVVDPRGRVVSWSDGMEPILGYGVDDVLGRHESMLAPGGARPGSGRVESELRARDGRIVPVATTTTPIRDEHGEVCGYETIVEDLSEVSKLRKEIKRGELALAEIVRASADAIFSCDRDGRITAWNRSATEVLGWDPSGTDAMRLSDLIGAAGAAELLRSVQARGPLRSFRLGVRQRSGERVTMEMSVTALESSDGCFAGVSVIGRDVREREQLEHQMVRSEKLAAVGTLASGLAHEIGTPLNVILASTEYVLLDTADGDPRRAVLASIVEETERIRRLVSDLLAFARGSPPDAGTTCPRAAIERVLRLLRFQLDKRSVAITVEAPEDLPSIAASEDSMHQVLLNVLMNALAAVRDGGRIAVTATCDQLAARAAVRFAIADDGPGIPPALRQRVVDPFFTTRADGTGLGLAVCNRIVANHGGTLAVGESALGGALLEIVFPATASSADAGAPPVVPPAALSHPGSPLGARGPRLEPTSK